MANVKTKLTKSAKNTKAVKEKIAEITKTAKAIEDVSKKAPVTMQRLIVRLAEIQALQKQLQEEEQALKAKVKAFMVEKSITELLTEEYKALYTVSYRTSLDKEAFEKEHPKYAKVLEQYYKKAETPTESLRITNVAPTKRRK